MEKRDGKVKKFIKENYAGYVAILPLILGILFFSVYPIISALDYSFHEYNPFKGTMGDFTFDQYAAIFTTELPTVLNSLKVTFLFVLIMVPANMVGGFLLAVWVNRPGKVMSVYKLLLYMPCLMPPIVSGFIWQLVGDPKYGVGTTILSFFGVTDFPFLASETTAFPTIIVYCLFGVSSNILIWLSALKNVPQSYYEAADVEGCGAVRKLLLITVPMITPFILYNLLTGIIGTIQIFGNIYTITSGGGPADSLNFFVIYIYDMAFTGRNGESPNISLAAALSFVLFAIIALLSGLMLKTSKWVYYTEDV